MTNQVLSTHQMVENLHVRFTGLETRLTELRQDHKDLREDVDLLRGGLQDITSRVDKHEGVAEEQLKALRHGITRLEQKFDRHTEREEQDRRWLFRLMVMTFLSAAGGLITLVFKSLGVG